MNNPGQGLEPVVYTQVFPMPSCDVDWERRLRATLKASHSKAGGRDDRSAPPGLRSARVQER
ncbi:MAG: hypothetical protein DWQ34_12925 [Planctomycetota bacterium]|nr:MAG: hypothetical protein DWQ34_12925 [Planctomycetota bacterium]